MLYLLIKQVCVLEYVILLIMSKVWMPVVILELVGGFMGNIVRTFIDYGELLDNIYDYLFDSRISCNVKINGSIILFMSKDTYTVSRLASDELHRFISSVIGDDCSMGIGTNHVSYTINPDRILLYSVQDKGHKVSKGSEILRSFIIQELRRNNFLVSDEDVILEKIKCVGSGNDRTYLYSMVMDRDCITDIHSILLSTFKNETRIVLNSSAEPVKMGSINAFKERLALLEG